MFFTLPPSRVLLTELISHYKQTSRTSPNPCSQAALLLRNFFSSSAGILVTALKIYLAIGCFLISIIQKAPEDRSYNLAPLATWLEAMRFTECKVHWGKGSYSVFPLIPVPISIKSSLRLRGVWHSHPPLPRPGVPNRVLCAPDRVNFRDTCTLKPILIAYNKNLIAAWWFEPNLHW